LTASGLPTDEFHFVGFLPHKSAQRRKKLEESKSVSGTLVLYESPYRIEKLLGTPKLAEMEGAAKVLGRPGAARAICEEVVRRINSRSDR